MDYLDYIGMPSVLAKSKLEEQGFSVKITKTSLPKIKVDKELVVAIRLLENNKVELIVGDFLINIEKQD